MVEKKSNFRWKYIRNEYRQRVRCGDWEDWFTITRPKRSKSSGQISNTVVCYHLSSVLKTKNLYLQFDDENGIDTCANLVTKALSGTGWNLGLCDTFYESDGKTEKIRSLSSTGKVGSYQLITNICGLFNAYPVYNGATKTVDIHALSNKLPQEEMIVGHNLTALSVELDSDSIVTRLYVEGEYGEDGYVGIDDVNPTGLSYLLNFDYYKEIGLFSAEHQEALDKYLADISEVNKRIKQQVSAITTLENELNTIWGQPQFVYYVGGLPYYWTEGLTEEQKKLSVGDEVYTLLVDGIYTVSEYSSGTYYDMIKFLTKTSYSMGSKEVAVEAKRKTIESLKKDLEFADEEDVAGLNEKISALENEISTLYIGDGTTKGLYSLMGEASTAVKNLKVAKDNLASQQLEQVKIEAAFSVAMGDLLKDGYWANTNYVEGQETFLYSDALEMSAELTKPTVSYTISLVHASDIWGEVDTEFLINGKVRIYDPELKVNDIVFVTKTVEYLDDESKGSVEISNDNLSITGKTFDSILGRITEIADMIEQKAALIDRADTIGKDGTISVTNLEGQIDLLKNKLISSTSNWYTDDNGNIVFLSVNGRSAMMLSGEGFMIANGKTADGEWNWRTFGTGNGFVADEITSGFLSADRIRAGSIASGKLDSKTQGLLSWVEGSEIRLSENSIKSTVTDTVIGEMSDESSQMRQSVINQTAYSVRMEFNEEFDAFDAAMEEIEGTKTMQDNINAWFDFSGDGLKIGGKTTSGTNSPFYTLQNYSEYAFYKDKLKLLTITGDGIDMLEGRLTQGNDANKLTADGVLSLSNGNILLNGQTNEVTIGQGGGTVNIGTDGTGTINLSTYQVRSGTESVSYNTQYNIGSNAATSNTSSEFVYTTTDNEGTQSSTKFTITTTYTKADLSTNAAPSIADGKLLQIGYNGKGLNIYADSTENEVIVSPSVGAGHLMGWDLISSTNMSATNISGSSIVATSMYLTDSNGGLKSVADQKWTIDKIVEILNNNDVIPSQKSKIDSAYWRAYNHSHAIKDGGDGTLTIGEVSSTGGSFNIANTQFHKDKVLAAENAVYVISSTGSGGVINVTLSNKKTFEIMRQSQGTPADNIIPITNQGGTTIMTVNAQKIYDNGYEYGKTIGANGVTVISWSGGGGVITATMSNGREGTFLLSQGSVSDNKIPITGGGSTVMTVDATSIYNNGWNDCRSAASSQKVLINYYSVGETLYDRDGNVATGPWYKGTEAYRYSLPSAK